MVEAISDELLAKLKSATQYQIDHPKSFSAWTQISCTDLIALIARLEVGEEAKNTLPRLTEDMIYAAAVGHYGKKLVEEVGGPVGISMTVEGIDYTFTNAMRRMWKSMRRPPRS